MSVASLFLPWRRASVLRLPLRSWWRLSRRRQSAWVLPFTRVGRNFGPPSSLGSPFGLVEPRGGGFLKVTRRRRVSLAVFRCTPTSVKGKFCGQRILAMLVQWSPVYRLSICRRMVLSSLVSAGFSGWVSVGLAVRSRRRTETLKAEESNPF